MSSSEYEFRTLEICSLEEVREIDLAAFDGLITIEDTDISEPFRPPVHFPPQLVMSFDDIEKPIAGKELPNERHVKEALEFVSDCAVSCLLIHCHAGISRSPALGLAVLADWYGPGEEKAALNALLQVRRLCQPNRLIVKYADAVLRRSGKLLDALERL